MTAVVVIGQRSIVAKKVGTDETPLVVQQSTVNAAVQVLPVPKQVVVVKALKAGKHVFVEKPLAVDSRQLAVVSKQLILLNT